MGYDDWKLVCGEPGLSAPALRLGIATLNVINSRTTLSFFERSGHCSTFSSRDFATLFIQRFVVILFNQRNDR